MLAILLTAATRLWSCVSSKDEPPTEDSKEITLNVRVSPSARESRSSTRVTVPDAPATPAVSNLDILLFTVPSDGSNTPVTFISMVHAADITPAADRAKNIYTYRAKIAVKPGETPDKICAVGLANATSIISDAKAQDWEDASATYFDIIDNITASGSTQPGITLWGIATTTIDTSAGTQAVRMPMLRDRAWAIVYPDEEKVKNFVLQTMTVWNRTDSYMPLPPLGNIDGVGTPILRSHKPSVPAGAAKIPSAMPAASLSEFVTEQDIRMGANATADDANRYKRAAIIVGGIYGSMTRTTYYRVDFEDADGNLVDVLRNHAYRICITAVNGPGSDTPDEAYNALTASITADVLDWDFIDIDAAFDGDNWLAIPRTVTFGPDAGETIEVPFSTNVDSSEWCMAWGAADDPFPQPLDGKPTPGPEGYPVLTDATGGFEARITDNESTGAGTLSIMSLRGLPDGTNMEVRRLFIAVTPRLRVIVNVVRSRQDADDGHLPWDDWNIFVTY